VSSELSAWREAEDHRQRPAQLMTFLHIIHQADPKLGDTANGR
jgi:hypothetical protein